MKMTLANAENYHRQLKLTLSGLVLRVFPCYIVELGTATQLLESFFFLGMFLALGVIDVFVSLYTLTLKGYNSIAVFI
jgi:hypothetical protein